VHGVTSSEKLSVVGEVQEKLFRIAVCERFGKCDLGGAYFFGSVRSRSW
jgi:hypothetical protein